MIIFALIGIIIILAIFADAFETIILPRRVNRRIRLSSLFFRTLWKIWKKGDTLFQSFFETKDYLGFYGPLSLIILFSLWAIALIVGFAFLNFGLHTDIQSPHEAHDFITYFYLSGGTFFTLGWNDTYPVQIGGRILAVIEGGIGFAFLAAVIGYLPVLYQGFSRREVNINLLDSLAGSPPNALHMLQQLSNGNITERLRPQFEKWETWCAEILETQVSYPILSYYRSQHDDQSWVAALIMILDASTLVLVSENNELHSYAKATFAIARHAAVDLTIAYYMKPIPPPTERMSKKDLVTIRKLLKETKVSLREGTKADEKLQYLRNLYEPYIQALSDFYLMPITPFLSDEKIEEAWRRKV